jgi:glycosyl transferase family 87
VANGGETVATEGPRGFDEARRKAVRDGLTLGGLIFAAYLLVIVGPQEHTVGFDAWAYWSVDVEHPYRLGAGALGAFPYSPVMVRVFAPAHFLAWPTFLFLWLAILVATVIWLGATGEPWWRGWRGALTILAFLPVSVELYHGNVHLLIAAAIALGFRYPAAWAFVLLTKVTPGVGLLWFAVRREWRRLAIALGVTAVVVVVSLAFDARLWVAWLEEGILPVIGRQIGQPAIPIPLWVRLPAAAALVIWGARTDRRWTVPASAALALPVLWFAGLSILAAIWTLDRPALRERQSAAT